MPQNWPPTRALTAICDAHPALEAHLAELRAIVDDAQADPACTLATVLWRLRTLYRVATGTDPWPDARR